MEYNSLSKELTSKLFKTIKKMAAYTLHHHLL